MTDKMVPAGSLNQAIGGPGRWSSQGIVIPKARQLLNRLIHKPTSPSAAWRQSGTPTPTARRNAV
jgi:hypothetical protein